MGLIYQAPTIELDGTLIHLLYSFLPYSIYMENTFNLIIYVYLPGAMSGLGLGFDMGGLCNKPSRLLGLSIVNITLTSILCGTILI